MSRLRPLDRLLLLLLTPLWCVCFALSLGSLGREVALPPVHVRAAEAPDRGPVVTAIPIWKRADPTLAVGDEIVRVGERSAAGVGPAGFRALAWSQRGADDRVPIEVARDGAPLTLAVHLRSGIPLGPTLPPAVVFVLAALFGLLRLPRSRSARAAFPAFMAMAFYLTSYFGETEWTLRAGQLVRWASLIFAAPLSLRLVRVFPDEAPLSHGWTRLAPWGFAVFAPLNAMSELGLPDPGFPSGVIAGVLNLVFFAFVAALSLRNYRRSDAVGRQRMRWVVYGALLANLPVAAALLIGFYDPDLGWLYLPSNLAMAILPLTILVAITREDLFDIDRMIGATTSFLVVSVVLLAGVLFAVPWAAGSAERALGVSPVTAQLAASLTLALLLVPIAWRGRLWLENRLLGERRAIEAGVGSLLRDLSGSRDLRGLIERLGTRVDALFRPEHSAVYARAGAEIVPVFRTGIQALPVLDAHGQWVPSLARVGEPCLAGGPELRRAGSEAERALAAELDAEVFVPVCREGDLALLLVLGPRRSREATSPTERTLLAAIAERAAAELARFEDAARIEEARELTRALRSERDEAARMSVEKSRFLAAASHDLRQPLHALGLLTAALDDRVRDPDARELVQQIQASAAAMEAMFDAVLDLSKLDAGVVEPEVRPIPLAPLLERLQRELAPQASVRGLRFRVRPADAWVDSDPVWLHRILQNLIVNAIRYTDRGSVLVAARRRGDTWRLEVRDSGRGIAQPAQRRIFEEYSQEPEARGEGGLGLGLSIVRRLSDLLGHPLALRSEPGRGSVFALTVPAAAAGPPVASADPVGTGMRIVVVDDDPGQRAALQALLGAWGHEVAAAADLDEARGLLGSGAADLLLTDWTLGDDITGADVFAVARANQPALPVLLVTGDRGDAPARFAREHDLLLLAKPVSPVRLRAALQHVRSAPSD